MQHYCTKTTQDAVFSDQRENEPLRSTHLYEYFFTLGKLPRERTRQGLCYVKSIFRATISKILRYSVYVYTQERMKMERETGEEKNQVYIQAFPSLFFFSICRHKHQVTIVSRSGSSRRCRYFVAFLNFISS